MKIDKMQIKYRKIKLKNKRAEGVFGLSFSMIFSIILIVFFIVIFFIAIKFFLNYQEKMKIALFFDDLKNDVAQVLNSNSASLPFKYSLPSGIEDVCFIDLRSPTRGSNNVEQNIYQYIFNEGGVDNLNNNVYLYAPRKDYSLNWKTINHINLTQRNPTCIEVRNGVASLRIQRRYEGYSVFVSAIVNALNIHMRFLSSQG